MDGNISRRRLGQAVLLAGTASVLWPAAARAAVNLRWMWWGNPERDRRTNAVIRGYRAKNPDLAVTAESANWADYWPKLATQVAGRRAPDVIQMDYRYLVEYARRGALLPLEDLMPNPLDLGGFDAAETSGGKVAGKIYGVSVGANAFAVHCDADAFRRAGVALPQEGWSWAEFEQAAAALTEAGPKGFYGAADASRSEDVLERYLHQRDKAFFTEDGQIGFSPDDIAGYFAYWGGLRRKGIVTPAELTATDQAELRTSMLTTGKAAIGFHHSNQLAGVQAMMKDRVVLADLPAQVPHGATGNYLKPSQLMSIWAKSPNAREAAALIRYVLADPEAVKMQGIERGVPESQALRDMMAPGLGPEDLAIGQFVSLVSRTASPIPPAPPKGGGQMNTLLPRIADKVAFAQASEVDGGRELFEDLTNVLKRA